MARTYPDLPRFDPRLEILPETQRELWPRLSAMPDDAVLYGGTAIAVRLGHRTSVDFDFFLGRSFTPGEMRHEIAGLGRYLVRRAAPDTLTVSVGDVWISLFGVSLAMASPPGVTTDTGLPIASLLDVGATKMQTIVDRAEVRDYVDIAAILESGIELEELLGAAQVVYGDAFSPMLALKALTSYADGSLPEVPTAVRERLTLAAGGVRRVSVVGSWSSRVSPFVVERDQGS